LTLLPTAQLKIKMTVRNKEPEMTRRITFPRWLLENCLKSENCGATEYAADGYLLPWPLNACDFTGNISVNDRWKTPLTRGVTAVATVAAQHRRRIWLRVYCVLALLVAPGALAAAQAAPDPAKVYQITYAATLDPKSGLAHATLTLKQPRRLVRGIELVMPGDRYRNIRPTSRIEVNGDIVTWRPLKEGGELKFDFVIDHKRPNGVQDARIEDTWALLKLDSLFPRASARVVKGATSQATLQLAAPKGWAIETPYGRGAGRVLDVSNPHRLFDRPLGWLLAGKLGVRRDNVGERVIRVASPLGTQPRANDVLAFVRWTLPSLLKIFPDFPPLLLIVSGADDMWRGGLSGAGSLYLHSSRPLISGNRTSPMLHELFHVASGLHGKGGSDWIIEGLAEFYSIELLQRAGGISEQRYQRSLETVARWSANTQCVATDRSQGKQTARAVVVMRKLDAEIRAASRGKASLDTLVQMLVSANRPVTNADFRAAAEKLINGPAKALADCP
jgi:hypothetical protein